MRIAMWSGPRNLSTAMMYSFAARGDCSVWDEPFYAAYLKMTGLAHPMGDEIQRAHDSDYGRVVERCKNPYPEGKPHFYMKHMAHHILDEVPIDWAKDCVNIHLIRHPARVIASYAAKRENPTLDSIGFVQQETLFNKLGGIVIDSFDIRANPKRVLKLLCDTIGLDWMPEMLGWRTGGRPEDGVWAAHWYGAVHQSTGFAGPEKDLPILDGKFAKLVEHALPIYQRLAAEKLI